MSVAKPWIPESPLPLTSHWEAGAPALVFSQATALATGGSQGPAAATGLMNVTVAATAAHGTTQRNDRRARRPAGSVADRVPFEMLCDAELDRVVLTEEASRTRGGRRIVDVDESVFLKIDERCVHVRNRAR